MSIADSLADQVLDVHRRLDAAGIGHAFGGALALAYCAEPRATDDIDINIALEPSDANRVLDALPSGIERRGDEDAVAERDGQLRVWWGHTAIDLFFGFHEFHHQLAANARLVPFADSSIPVIDGADLVVCKALFNRSKDWVDIEAIVRDGRTELARAHGWLDELLGRDAPQVERLNSMVKAVSAHLESGLANPPPTTPPPDAGLGR